MKTIFLALIILILLGSGFAYAGDYALSAHGDSSSGVDRNGSFPAYAKGNCAHCHEQHASIGGAEPAPNTSSTPSDPGPDKFCLLGNNFDTSAIPGSYTQDDNACFYCHCKTAATTYQTPAFDNNTYSETFGGYTDNATESIMDAFNLASYHNLNDVLNFAKATWPSTFTDNSNPCSACHNVHIAKRNKANQGDPTYTAISKPSVHDSLWGDDTPNERMTATAYGTNYQPPNYTTSNLEPDGAGVVKATQAAKTPDYNTFCLDCHQYEVTSSSMTSANPGTTDGKLTAIDWSATGEKHGLRDADEYISVNAPYTAGTGVGYVLSCLDCHEPHGSPNVALIRNSVNGGELTANVTSLSSTDCAPVYTDHDDNLKNLCLRCHGNLDDIHHLETNNDACYDRRQCGGCHEDGAGDAVNCSCCHYHGSSRGGLDFAPDPRITF